MEVVSEEGKAELDRVLLTADTPTVDVFEEFEKIRICVSKLLPSDRLATLLESQPNLLFAGVSERLVRVY